jgi:cell pole-organizing protein PopZ
MRQAEAVVGDSRKKERGRVIGKTQVARQPSIDELLTSIRQAIHERVQPAAPAAPSQSPRLVHTTPAAPSQSAEARPLAIAGQEGFAGLLGGDVRLEEALARLHQTGWRRGPEPAEPSEAPVAAPIATAPAALPEDEPRLRPSIEAWTGGTNAPVAPAEAAKTRPSPARPSLSRAAPIRQAPVRPAPAPRQREPLYSPAPAAHQPPVGGWNDDFRDEGPLYDAAPHVSTSAGDRASDLLSSEAARAANSAFGRLAEAMTVRAAESERTLDEITQDCLRPLLKGWLDKNLPALVERLVREEIARVARPGR